VQITITLLLNVNDDDFAASYRFALEQAALRSEDIVAMPVDEVFPLYDRYTNRVGDIQRIA